MVTTPPTLSPEQLALAISWPGAENIRPCLVKIGRTTYAGFAYTVPEGWGADDGTPQPCWYETRFYLLSDTIPPSHDRYLYRIEGDEGDWFFGGHVTPETAASERFGQYHPLGAHFMLMRWPHERFGDRIDDHEIGRNGRIHLRPRMTIEVTYTTPEGEEIR